MAEVKLYGFEAEREAVKTVEGGVVVKRTGCRASEGKWSLEVVFPPSGGRFALPAKRRKWSAYEALKFDVYAERPVKSVWVRVEDADAKDDRERFSQEFGLRKGWSGVQIEMSEIARAVNLEKVKAMTLSVGRTGRSLTLGLDRVRLGVMEDGYDTRLAPYEYLPRQDIEYATAVETPHVKWAEPFADGPIRGFFIPGVRHGRDMVELMQRLSLKPTTVSIDRAWDINCWGSGDHYGHIRGDRNDYRLVHRYVEQELTGFKRFDVMMVPGINGWNDLPKRARDAIMKRVRQGAGLVLIHPFTGEAFPESRDLWDISPLVDCPNDTVDHRGYPVINQEALATGEWKATGAHYITDGVPMEALPTQHLPVYKYQKVNGQTLIAAGEHPVLAVRNYGKGRVVGFAYQEQGFTPMEVDPTQTGTWDDFYPALKGKSQAASQVTWNYWEYYYSLLCKALVWAARRETSAQVKRVASDGRTVELEVAAQRKAAVTVDVTVNDKFARQEARVSRRQTLNKGLNRLRLALPEGTWNGGLNLVDAVVRQKETRLDWGSAAFWSPQEATVASVALDKEVYDVGATMCGTVKMKGRVPPGAVLNLTLMDDRGRDLAVQERPAQGRKVGFRFNLRHFVGRYARVRVEVRDGARAVDQFMSDEAVVVPVLRNRPEYRSVLSHATGHKHYFQDAVRQAVRQNGSDFGHWGARHNNNCGVWGIGIYWYHREPYLEQKKNYYATLDKRYLWRNPCLSDPAHLRKLKAAIRKEVKKRLPFRFDDYFVADESSVTCYTDAFDLCFSDHCMHRFRTWLKGRYRTLDALNQVWETDFPSWDKVVPLTTDEAKAEGNLAPWMDHRTFMSTVFADTLKAIRDAIRSVDPEGRTALSGTQVSVAYNGCDWWQLAPHIDRMLCYAGGDQWELHRSFNPDAAVGFWTGYGSSGLAVQNAIWKALFHNVNAPNLFWMYSYLNADLSYCKSARDMGAVFKELRHGGIGRLLMEAQRQHDGIAIHYSYPSIFATTIQGDFERYAANRTGWTHLIEDLGLQYNFLAYGELEAGRLRKGDYKVLILPYTLALSEKERAEIEAFVARGGRIIADGYAGLLDDRGRSRSPGLLDAVFGIGRPTGSEPDRSQAKTVGDLLVGSGALKGIRLAENLTAADGNAQARAGETSAVVLNRHKRGRACYLNFLMDEYTRLREGAADRGAAIRSAVGRVLAEMGVVPEIQVVDVNGQPLRHLEVVIYRLGKRRFLCLRKENVTARAFVDRDGVTTYADEALGTVVEERIEIRLPKAFHAVNLRTGEDYGRTEKIQEGLRVGDAMVIGLLPASPAKFRISGPESVDAGSVYRFDVEAGPEASGQRVLRINVYGPDGEYRDLYSGDALVRGQRYRREIPTAFNDDKGSWKVAAIDVGSQQAQTLTFEVC